MLSLVISTRLALGRQRVRFLKCGVALIVPGGYCSRVALHSWRVRSLGTSHRNNRMSISPPPARKDGTPSCQARLIGGRKRRVAQSGNLHWCSSHYKFVSGGLDTQVPSVSVNGQPGPFPAPLACFKSLSNRSHSSCRDVSQQSPQASLARELVTGDPMDCSIAGRPRKHPSWHHDIIVGPNEEGLVLQILPKLFSHGPFQGQELQFRRVILQLASLEAMTGIGHRVITAVVLLLGKHCPQPLYRCISLQQKGPLEVRECQHRCCEILAADTLCPK